MSMSKYGKYTAAWSSACAEPVPVEPGATTGGRSRPNAAAVIPTSSSTVQASSPEVRLKTPVSVVSSSRYTSASAM